METSVCGIPKPVDAPAAPCFVILAALPFEITVMSDELSIVCYSYSYQNVLI